MANPLLYQLGVPFTVPAVGLPVAIVLVGNPTFVPGTYLAIDAGGTDPFYAKVQRTTSGLVVQAVLLGSAVIGQRIGAGVLVQVAGPVGPVGPPGQAGVGPRGVPGAPGPPGNSASFLIAPFVIPAVGSAGSVQVSDPSPFFTGARIYIQTTGPLPYAALVTGPAVFGSIPVETYSTGSMLASQTISGGAPCIASGHSTDIPIGPTLPGLGVDGQHFYSTTISGEFIWISGGWVQIGGGSSSGGKFKAEIAAGDPGTTISGTKTLVNVLVTSKAGSPSSNPMKFTDGPGGDVIGLIEAYANVGYVKEFNMPTDTNNEIVSVGDPGNPGVTICYD